MKFTTLFIFLNLFCFYGFNQINELDKNGEKHGKWTKNYPNSTTPMYVGTFKHGKPIGTFTYYHPNNKVKAIIKHAENSSRSEAYMYHENKNLMAYGIYMNQKKDSVWTYYSPEGDLSYKETYKNDVLNGKKVIYYIPEIRGQNTTQVMSEKNYENGVLQGATVEYFIDGIKKLEGQYKNGRFDGEVKRYHPNGKIESVQHYSNKVKHGWWITYNESGKEEARTYYRYGEVVEGEALKKLMEKYKEKGINPNK